MLRFVLFISFCRSSVALQMHTRIILATDVPVRAQVSFQCREGEDAERAGCTRAFFLPSFVEHAHASEAQRAAGHAGWLYYSCTRARGVCTRSLDGLAALVHMRSEL